MLLKDIKFEKCKSCGANKRTIQERVYGCDNCKKVIDLNKKRIDWLEVTVFHQGSKADHHHLCSWKCVIRFVRKVKSDYFITLPFLHYNKGSPETRASAFLKLVKI